MFYTLISQCASEIIIILALVTVRLYMGLRTRGREKKYIFMNILHGIKEPIYNTERH